eukprot:CAMPEP_0172712742 /NCGR_PEP_ID=MMETSP1074-20121228/61275_1 /TAXON_ID=2916 /ORGANISM="Ceratium fusus, Strain PA161109" /LENGTH=435 /DNA_ID=CAMNT_0013536715 /DNA_START=81 /DNA_END=1388 /DNA_ORIENTATION=+
MVTATSSSTLQANLVTRSCSPPLAKRGWCTTVVRPGPAAVVCRGPAEQATPSSGTALQTPQRMRSQSMELPVGGETRRPLHDVSFGSWRGFSTPPKGGGPCQATVTRMPSCTGGGSSASCVTALASSPLGSSVATAADGAGGAGGAETLTRRDSMVSPESTLPGSAKFAEPSDYDAARMHRWLLGDIAMRLDEQGDASNHDLERALEAVQRHSLELRVEAAHMESACLEMERARVEAEKTRLEQRTLEYRVEAEETRLETGQLERRLEELRQLQELERCPDVELPEDMDDLETSGETRGICDRQEGEAAAGLPRNTHPSSSSLGRDDVPDEVSAGSRSNASFRRIRAVESSQHPKSGSAVVSEQGSGATRASPPLATRCPSWAHTVSTGTSLRFSVNAPPGGSQRHCKMGSSASAVQGRATLPGRLQVPALPGSK